MPTNNVRNTRTTHPLKSARRERALNRLVIKEGRGLIYEARKHVEAMSLEARIGKPPRSWPKRHPLREAE